MGRCLFDKILMCWLYLQWKPVYHNDWLVLSFYQPVQDCSPTSSVGSRLSTKQKHQKLKLNQDLFTFSIERWTETKHEENGVSRQNLGDTISNVRPPQENTYTRSHLESLDSVHRCPSTSVKDRTINA